MKKVLILMLVFAAVTFAAQVDKDGDVLLTSPYEVLHAMVKSISSNGFDIGTKPTTEIMRDIWVGSDFDADGNKEVLLASYATGGKAYVYEITGDNTATLFFETPDHGGNTSACRDVKFADLDGNGMQELLVSINVSSSSAIGGLYVYEYDTVGDSMRAPVHLFSDLAAANRWYVENMFVDDVDGDGVQEFLVGNNGSVNDYDEYLIYSITSGTFAGGDYVWTQEFKHERTDASFPLGGSPYGPVTADMDGDGKKEVLFAAWDNGAMLIVEADAADTYTVHNYIETDLDVRDDFAFYNFAPADLDGDGRDEVYLSMYDGGALYCITCPVGTDLSAMTTANVHKIDALGSSGGVCTQLGDWDGNGKMNIYASGGGSVITVHEYQGGDPTVASNWVALPSITHPSFSGVYGMRYAGDLDGDGFAEIYGANTGAVTVSAVAVEPPTQTVFISELADPNNDATMRFVELYNPTDSDIDFTEGSGWKLNKYTNDAAAVSQTLALTGTIKTKSCYVIATGVVDTDFETAYGIAPDLFDGANDNVAGSNGDDNIELVDGTGAVVDLFGVPGEDGTGTNHEFEDGRAVRKATVTTGNPTWDVTEWSIDSDAPSGIGPIDAPDGFDPGVWPTIIPLEIAYAMSVSLTEIEVKYTVDVSTVNVADYSVLGSSGITFTAADIDAADATIVKLTAGADIVGDVVLDTLVDAANTDSTVAYIGITPIALTNTTNPGGIIDDVHPATFKGIISANDAYNNVWISDAEDAYNGVMIFDYNFDAAVSVGDEVLITAIRDTYNNLTELVSPTLLVTISSGNTPFGPTKIAGADIDTATTADTDPAEKYEGQLVKISNAYVDSYTDYEYHCTNDGGATYFKIGDNVDYHLSNVVMTVGEKYNITGVVDYSYEKYRLNPRGAADIVYCPKDLTLTFEDDSDAAYWGNFDEANSWTATAFDATGGVDGSGALHFTDAGWGFLIKREILATADTEYKLTMDVKVDAWTHATNTLDLSITGLSSTEPTVTVSGNADYTTVTLSGVADDSTKGFIRFYGMNDGNPSSLWIDNLVFDDDYHEPGAPHTIAEIQDTTGSGSDASVLIDVNIITKGIVTAVGTECFIIQDGDSAWSAVWVNSLINVALGDSVEVEATVTENYGFTELDAFAVTVINSGNTVPAPLALTTGAASAEMYESVLLSVSGTCDNPNIGYGEWSIDDGSGSVIFDDLFYAFTPTIGWDYDVTGVLLYSFSAFKVLPRDADDIIEHLPDVVLPLFEGATDGTFDLEWTFNEWGGGDVDGDLVIIDSTGSAWASHVIAYSDTGYTGIAHVEDALFMSYTISADIYIVGPQDANFNLYTGLAVKSAHNTGEYYRFIIRNSSTDNGQLKFQGYDGVNFHISKAWNPGVDFTALETGWHNFKVTVVGNNFWAYVDGLELPGCPLSDDAPFMTAGFPGIFKYNTGVGTVMFDNFSVVEPISGIMPIANARADADGDFMPDLLNEYVTVNGIVISPDFGLGYTTTTDIWIHDGTGGIHVYTGVFKSAAVLGDSIEVTGKIADYNGEIELVPDAAEDIVVLSSGCALPEPTLITIADIDEPDEADLVIIKNVHMVDPTEWPPAGENANVFITDGGPDTLIMRIDKDTDLAGWIVPYDVFDVIGIVDQYSFSDPPNDGYQIKPRFQTDFLDAEVIVPIAEMNEGFEDVFPPDGWKVFATNILAGNPAEPWSKSDNAPVSGTYNAYMSNYDTQSDCWLVTPPIDLLGDMDLLKFYARDDLNTSANDFGSELKVYASILSGRDTADFVLVSTISEADCYDATPEFTIDLKQFTDADYVFIGFMVHNFGDPADPDAGGDNWSLDDVRLDSTQVGIDKDAQLPMEYSLSQNYPNPFNPTTNIKLALPEAANVNLCVYNLIGQEVAVIHKGQLQPGYHSFILDASRLASGVYFYKVEANNFFDLKKMTILK